MLEKEWRRTRPMVQLDGAFDTTLHMRGFGPKIRQCSGFA